MTYQPLTLEYAEKQAKKVRKQRSMTTEAARNYVAQSYGYEDWKHMLEGIKLSERLAQ